MAHNSFWNVFCHFVIYGIILRYSCAKDIPDIRQHDENYGKTWMFFPDGDGNAQIIELNQPGASVRFTFAHENPDTKIVLWLFDKEHKTNPILLKATGLTNRDNFTLTESYDGNRKTKILIHGWKNNLNSDVIQSLKNAYLEEDEDYNIIAVDWGEMADDNNYLSSAASTRNVGRNVAMVIDYMIRNRDARPEDIHIIGHSLGAHAAGYAGMFTKSKSGKKVGRITGLDPAYPAFQDAEKINQNLDPSDAEFVDVVHTCAGMIGHDKNLGHADFFPNGGKAAQPGCDFPNDFFCSCSHGRSYKYFAESIQTKNGFMSFRCASWDDYQAKKCEGDPVPMGEATPESTNGTYFLETSGGPRFARLLKIN